MIPPVEVIPLVCVNPVTFNVFAVKPDEYIVGPYTVPPLNGR